MIVPCSSVRSRATPWPNIMIYVTIQGYVSGSWRSSPVMGPIPFEFVGNPAPLGEAAPRGGEKTAPRTIAYPDAERF